MSLLTAVTRGARAVPQLAWQISAVPAQALLPPAARQDRTGLRFLAAVTSTAALGVVDWPVALLVAGGYLLARRQPSKLEPDDHTDPQPADTAAAAATGNRQGRDPTPPFPPTVPTTMDTANLAAVPPAPAPPAPVPPAPVPPAPVPPADGQADGLPASVPPGHSTESAVPVTAASSRSAAAPNATDRIAQVATSVRPPRGAPGGQRTGPADVNEAQTQDPKVRTGEPWAGYDQMTVPGVLGRLSAGGVDLLAIAQYESAHRNRKMVQAAITRRRGAST